MLDIKWVIGEDSDVWEKNQRQLIKEANRKQGDYVWECKQLLTRTQRNDGQPWRNNVHQVTKSWKWLRDYTTSCGKSVIVLICYSDIGHHVKPKHSIGQCMLHECNNSVFVVQVWYLICYLVSLSLFKTDSRCSYVEFSNSFFADEMTIQEIGLNDLHINFLTIIGITVIQYIWRAQG